MATLRDVFLVDAVRTPIGRHRGALSSVRADDLAAHILLSLGKRTPALYEKLDQVIFGATNQAGEDNRDVARMAVLLAGLPYELPAVTVNRLCGSGLEAVCDAVRRIATGEAEVAIGGGVESMTRAPFVFGKADEPFPRSPPKVFDTSLGWRFENPKMAERFPLLSMGETAEEVAAKWKIGREEQDAFALASQKKAAAAIAAGAFDREIVPVTLPAKGKGAEPAVFAKDESPRGDVTLEGLAKLPTVFRKGGTVTAGNSSPLNDGASGVLLASEDVVRAHGLEPLARVVAHATAGVHPNTMGEGPIPAGTKVLARCGWKARRSRSDRAQRSVRLPGARLHPGSRPQPRSGQCQRRRHRAGPSHRLERRPRPRNAALGDEGARSQARHGRAVHRRRSGDRDGCRALKGLSLRHADGAPR